MANTLKLVMLILAATGGDCFARERWYPGKLLGRQAPARFTQAPAINQRNQGRQIQASRPGGCQNCGQVCPRCGRVHSDSNASQGTGANPGGNVNGGPYKTGYITPSEPDPNAFQTTQQPAPATGAGSPHSGSPIVNQSEATAAPVVRSDGSSVASPPALASQVDSKPSSERPTESGTVSPEVGDALSIIECEGTPLLTKVDGPSLTLAENDPTAVELMVAKLNQLKRTKTAPLSGIQTKWLNDKKAAVVAKRLESVFKRPVEVREIAGSYFAPSYYDFKIHSGTNKAGAERIIDELVSIRTNVGLTKEDLPFRADDEGKIHIHGRNILNYGEGETDVQDATFAIIENQNSKDQFAKAFPANTNPKSRGEIPSFVAMAQNVARFSDPLGFGLRSMIERNLPEMPSINGTGLSRAQLNACLKQKTAKVEPSASSNSKEPKSELKELGTTAEEKATFAPFNAFMKAYQKKIETKAKEETKVLVKGLNSALTSKDATPEKKAEAVNSVLVTLFTEGMSAPGVEIDTKSWDEMPEIKSLNKKQNQEASAHYFRAQANARLKMIAAVEKEIRKVNPGVADRIAKISKETASKVYDSFVQGSYDAGTPLCLSCGDQPENTDVTSHLLYEKISSP